jgi:predicted DNA repair protein MutK
MASGFFAILDDIAALMDDVAVTSKIATQKTAGILGDDLAVNAEKATGFMASREIPVLWAITKGSFINKLIILPVVFLLNWLYAPAINYVLILGGLYLAFEGVEKIIEFLFHREKKGHEVVEEVIEDQSPEEIEKAKVKSAITTDFILCHYCFGNGSGRKPSFYHTDFGYQPGCFYCHGGSIRNCCLDCKNG